MKNLKELQKNLLSFKQNTLSQHVWVVAEAGVNHNGSLALAKYLVDAAADAGADIVKFQSFKTVSLVSRFSPKAQYQKETTDAGESQRDMIRALELSESAHLELIEHCRRR